MCLARTIAYALCAQLRMQGRARIQHGRLGLADQAQTVRFLGTHAKCRLRGRRLALRRPELAPLLRDVHLHAANGIGL